MGGPEHDGRELEARIRELEQELARRDDELRQLRADRHGDLGRLAQVVANAPITLWVVGRDRRISFAAGAGLRGIGLTPEAAVGMHVYELFPALMSFDAQVEEVRAGKTVLLTSQVGDRTFESHIGGLFGRDGGMVGVLGVSVDITTRVAAQNALEMELRRVERLETFAGVASGFGHDFNNLLTAILGYIGLAAEQVERAAEARASLASAERAALQAKDLTVRLLAFARGSAPKRERLALGRVVEDSVAVALRGSSTRAVLHIAPELWHVEGDASQLGQICHNLLLNAAQSMPEGGEVEISAVNVDVAANSGVPLPAGRHVRVRVQDRGQGIPPAELDRIFDPYFTTKPSGTGLGLTTTHSIVRGHGGHIRVSSTVGLGTRVDVFLPATELAPAPSAPAPPKPTVKPGTRVLLMDDDPTVTDTARQLLRAMGCEVEVVSDGAQCVAAYRERLLERKPFEVVILDLTVPGGMGARETIGKLRDLDPAVRAIVTTGYSSDPLVSDHATHGFVAALSKPYRLDDLALALSRALAAP